MKALRCHAFGQIASLSLDDCSIPVPGHGELRIRVAAAGINYPDAVVVQGKYQTKPPLPFAPGIEAAGYVDEIGPGVSGFAAGDRVCCLAPYDAGAGNSGMAANAAPYGCFAEFVVVKETTVGKVPDGVDLDVAGGLTTTYITAHHGLRHRANLQAGETLLVLGAAGGVGLAAVEIGKAIGARVIAGASTPEKLALCRSYGADDVFAYRPDNVRDTIRSLTVGRGADVVFDPVGGRFSEPAFRSIAPQGRFLVVGFTDGSIASLPLNLPLLKNAAVLGVAMSFLPFRQPELFQSSLRELMGWLQAGSIRSHVSRRFALADGAEALQWMLDRKATGKTVISLAT